MTALVVAVFALVYAGMAAGRVPGLSLDRAGVALIGAIVLYAAGAIGAEAAVAAIDGRTLLVLFGLMVVSAQASGSGFYHWCAWRIAASRVGSTRLTVTTVLVAGALSAVFANDVVVYAMTPMLCRAIVARGLDARPFLIALAAGANAGSAATVIGNPQNILIAQHGDLDFLAFLAVCGPPALIGLVAAALTIRVVWARALAHTPDPVPTAAPAVDRAGALKAGVATVALLVAFAAGLPQVTSVLVIAGALLISRRRPTRAMLGDVDWPLLVLFAALFVVTAAFTATGLPARFLTGLEGAGIDPTGHGVLAAITLAGSNTVGNVPLVVLLLAAMPTVDAAFLHALAVLSTLAGNLLLTGSIANIIVAERAASVGQRFGFVDHALAGVPMTLLAFAVALGWFALVLP